MTRPETQGELLAALADFGSSLSARSLPPSVVAHAPYVMLDVVGTILGGSTRSEVAALASTCHSVPDATILRPGLPRTVHELATVVNGTAAVWLELDPGHARYRTHAPAHVLPAALATAEHLGVAGEDLIAAFVIGCEIAYRVGGALRPRPEVNAHGTWPIIGAAAAVARLHGLDSRTFARALGLSCHLALAAAFRASVDGATVRNAFVGVSGELAIRAVWLAKAGFTPLDAPAVEIFGRILGTSFEADRAAEGLGRRFEFTNDFVKFYACCHHLYGAIEAVGEISEGEQLIPEDINEISVSTYRHAAQFATPAPSNELAAKFSLPFAVAARIVRGNVGPDAFTHSALKDGRLRALATRVRVREDPALTAMYPQIQQANVEVLMKNGRRVSATGFGHKGDGDLSPTSLRARIEKFDGLAGAALPAAATTLLRSRILEASSVGNVAHMFDDVRDVALRA